MRDFLSDRYKLSWNFAEHQAHIDPATGKHYLGGQDWQTPTGAPAYAPASGSLGMSGSIATIILPDGSKLRARHLRTLVGAHIRQVVEGEQIGTYGDGGLWAHWESETKNGVRQPPAFLGMTTAGSAGTPIGDDDMTIEFIQTKENPGEKVSKTWVRTPAGIFYVSEPSHIGLLERLRDFQANYPTKEGGFLPGEVAILNTYLQPPAVQAQQLPDLGELSFSGTATIK